MPNVYRKFNVGDIVRAKCNLLNTDLGFAKIAAKRGSIGIILGRSKNDIFVQVLFQNTNKTFEIMPEDQAEMLEHIVD